MWILLANSDWKSRSSLTDRLQDLGHDVVVVTEAEDAVRAAFEVVYDAVLLVCENAELDSLEAARAIRRREVGTGRHVPIICLTSSVPREQCLAAGMNDYAPLEGPPGELKEVLERWVFRFSVPVLSSP
jgi:two-component system sensor histidine kinase EvgS